MKKLLILPIVLGLCACKEQPDAEIAKCVKYIQDKVVVEELYHGGHGVFIMRSVNEHFSDAPNRASVRMYEKPYPISADDAVKISSNWQTDNFQIYSTDDGIQDYEHDACDVVDRLDTYIYDNQLNEIWHINPDGSPYSE